MGAFRFQERQKLNSPGSVRPHPPRCKAQSPHSAYNTSRIDSRNAPTIVETCFMVMQ